jgi:hypothetical protein
MNAKEVQAGSFEARHLRIQQHIQQRRNRQKSGISVLCVQESRTRKTNSHHSSSGCLTHLQDTTQPPHPAEQPTAGASQSGARPESPRPGAVERGAGRERRGRNLRPLPQPMDGSNTAIVRVFQEGTGIEREQGQGLFTKKSLACSTPPGTCFPSLMTTPQPY